MLRFPSLPAATAALSLVLTAAPARAGENLFGAGVRMQSALDFEPGKDWLAGPEVGFSNYHLFRHRLELKAAYLTSRLENGFRPNILRQDCFLGTAVWHFRRGSLLDPVALLDLGYARFDTEFPKFDFLDNDTWVGAVQLGLALNLAQGRYGLFQHFGCNLISPRSGVLLPGVFAFGLWVML